MGGTLFWVGGHYFGRVGVGALFDNAHSNLPKDDFRVTDSKALNLIMVPTRTRFSQPSFMGVFLFNPVKELLMKNLLSI